MGSRNGISTEKIEALNDYAKSPLFSDTEKIALEYADAITDTSRDVDDELLDVPDPPRRPLLQEQVSVQDQRRRLALSPRCRAQGGHRGRGRGAGFYFHIDPTTCFMAGGIWMPARPALLRIREAIAAQPTAWRGSRAHRDSGGDSTA